MASFIQNHRKHYKALDGLIATKPLAGNFVLVTGAGRGVGEHIIRELSEAGASKIAILGRDSARINAARERFAAAYPSTSFVAFSADVINEAGISSILGEIGAPDILVNNAGYFPDDGPFIEQDLKQWWTGFEINILGTAIVTQQYLRALGTQGGVVLNVSTGAAHMRWASHGVVRIQRLKMTGARIFENFRPDQIESDGFTRPGAPAPPEMTDGSMTGEFFAGAATTETDGLSGRFLWAEWDIEMLKAKKAMILEKDLLLFTVDGFDHGT